MNSDYKTLQVIDGHNTGTIVLLYFFTKATF